MVNRSREIIDALGLRKVDVATKMGITPVGLNQILNTAKPKLETLEKLADAIDIPVWKLFLTDEEIREVNLTTDIEASRINGFVKIDERVYEIHSFDDLSRVLDLKYTHKRDSQD
jgi:transcriptional regulator with XRE-family HTH domain